MTKQEIVLEENRLDQLIAELEGKHPDRSPERWMPWHTEDDSLSMAHWHLVQARLNLKHQRPERHLTADHTRRLQEGRKAVRTAA